MTTFAEQESSASDSQPVELYAFHRADGDVVEKWFYANAEKDVLFNGDLYSAQPGIKRSTIQQNGEDTTMQLTVDIPLNACVTDQLKGELSTSPILITVYRWQRGLDDAEAATIFSGEVAGPLFSGSTCTLTCTSEEAAWSDTLARTYVQRTCPFMVYDTFCGADPFPVTNQVTVTAVSDDFLTITVDENDPTLDNMGADSAYYQSGYIKVHGAFHFVSQQDGHDLILQTPLNGAVVGEIYDATMGCDRTTAGCIAHDNIERFGGFPLIPVVNPWAGLS